MKPSLTLMVLALLMSAFLLSLGGIAHSQGNYDLRVVTWSPDTKLVAQGYKNGQIEIYNRNANEVIQSSVKHKTYVTALAWNSTGTMLVSGSRDGEIIVWDSEHLEVYSRFTALKDGIAEIVWSNNDSNIIVAGFGVDDRDSLKKFSLSGDTLLVNIAGAIEAISLNPSGNLLAIANPGGFLSIYDEATLSNLGYKEIEEYFTSTAWSPDGNFVATGTLDGSIYIWGLNENTLEQRWSFSPTESQSTDWYTTSIRSLIFSEDQTKLITITGEGILQEWNAVDGTVLSTKDYGVPIYSADWSPYRTLLIYSSDESMSSENQPFTISPLADLETKIRECSSDKTLISTFQTQIEDNEAQSFVDTVEAQRGTTISETCANELVELASFELKKEQP
jgi:WD40 repeat protein